MPSLIIYSRGRIAPILVTRAFIIGLAVIKGLGRLNKPTEVLVLLEVFCFFLLLISKPPFPPFNSLI